MKKTLLIVLFLVFYLVVSAQDKMIHIKGSNYLMSSISYINNNLKVGVGYNYQINQYFAYNLNLNFINSKTSYTKADYYNINNGINYKLFTSKNAFFLIGCDFKFGIENLKNDIEKETFYSTGLNIHLRAELFIYKNIGIFLMPSKELTFKSKLLENPFFIQIGVIGKI